MQEKRWIYRFDNFKKAFALLRETVQLMHQRELSQLEKEGLIQRFEYTWELAWKVLKDYLDDTGVVLETTTPASVIRAAFATNVIGEGEIWMKALKARNQMSHTYDLKIFDEIIINIRSLYLPVLENMHATFVRFEKQND